jgi:hypothetical protein
MKKQIKITNYSCYDNYTVADKGDNWSRVVSKMVQLAGRYCERFASDVVYDAKSFISAVENKENYDRVLFFRECGISTFGVDLLGAIEGTEYIQAWHLTYNAKTEEQELTRVNVYFERKW